MTYPIHTLNSAPEASQPVLVQLQQAFGLIPNIAGAMANSPELLKGFWGLFQQVHSGTFSEAEIQTLLLTNAVTNACNWAVAFHTMLALKEGLTPVDVEAIRTRGVPADARLAALSHLARSLIKWPCGGAGSGRLYCCRLHPGAELGNSRGYSGLDDHQLCRHHHPAAARGFPAATCLAGMTGTAPSIPFPGVMWTAPAE
jgi:AhpD family alkylhydroperoxidase